MNLAPYFSRINLPIPPAPTLAALKQILFHHVTTIPFENLSVLLGQPPKLDLPSLEQKLLHDKRGGYCFEQNGLLLEVLTTLGYEVTPVSARVRLLTPREVTPPRTHLFLKVDIDGVPYLADAGVGGFSPTAPLRLDLLNEEQPTPHEPRRIIRENGRYYHQLKSDDVWSDVCEFTLEEMPMIDRELANYWTSTHPSSRFRQNVLAARANPDGTRIALQNDDLTHRRGPTVLSQRRVTEPGERLTVLKEHFGLSFPKGTTFPVFPTAPASNTSLHLS